MTFTYDSGVTPRASEAKLHAALVQDVLTTLETLDGGTHSTDARYYASTADLELQRYRLAQLLARMDDAERLAFFDVYRRYVNGETSCTFCDRAFTSLASVVAIGGELLHGRCATEHAAAMAALSTTGASEQEAA